MSVFNGLKDTRIQRNSGVKVKDGARVPHRAHRWDSSLPPVLLPDGRGQSVPELLEEGALLIEPPQPAVPFVAERGLHRAPGDVQAVEVEGFRGGEGELAVARRAS